jgi:DNA-binding HxlR family transcriptional regulator
MARTYKKVRYSPKSKGKEYTPVTAAQDVERAFQVLEGRWKLLILFHLFGGNMLRFSELEKALPAISQKMLIQQLRQMEKDGIVRRIVHHQVPPKVEYGLTDWGQALCPALDALLKWAALREEMANGAAHSIRQAAKAHQGSQADRTRRPLRRYPLASQPASGEEEAAADHIRTPRLPTHPRSYERPLRAHRKVR